VIVAVPAPTPLTSPPDDTVATLPALVAQLIARPDSALPLASRGVAPSCTVWPTVRLAVAGLTVTEATGTTLTVTVALPLFPSLVAVIVAVPAPTPLTSPLDDTVATLPALVAQLIARPASAFPLASRGVAPSCTVWPTVRFAVAGLTVTEATGTTLTVMVALPLFPSLVAVIVAVPAPTPLTSPLDDTVATLPALVAQLTLRPANVFPAESFKVAMSCTVCPTARLAAAGLTLTAATGAGALPDVVPCATFESAPNTASTARVPRNATSWNSYAVAAPSPNTVQLRLVPTVAPLTGVAHVPCCTCAAEPHAIGATANRTS
jgi:hypothetical protein